MIIPDHRDCGIFGDSDRKLKLIEAPIITVIGKAYWDVGHAPKDQSNRRSHLPSYAAWEIHPVMKITTERSAFLLWHFSPGDKIQNCPAQFLAVCWIVRVEFKFQRLRHGFSLATPCCSANRFQRSSAITSIRLETERFSKDAICSSLFRCSYPLNALGKWRCLR